MKTIVDPMDYQNDQAERDQEKAEYLRKVEFLRRYRDAQRTERRLIEEMAQLRAEAASVSQALSGTPGGSGDGQAIPRAVERIADAESRLASAYGAALAARAEVKDAIDTVPDPLRRDILTRRYILGQRWERIAADLDRDKRWVLRLHHRAVDGLTIESH